MANNKTLDSIRTTTFIILLLTSIPLFVNYILGQGPSRELIIHLHVWFGLIFLILAIISMRLRNKK